jgi:hypothetical protein
MYFYVFDVIMLFYIFLPTSPNIHLLKTKRNLLHIRNQSVPRFKHFLPAKVAVCSESRTKHSTQSEHHVKFLMLNLVVSKETARL